MHYRTRSILSISRRRGLQLPREVADGRAPRHAQGWRDQQPTRHFYVRRPFAGRALDAALRVALGLAITVSIAGAGVVLFDDVLPALLEAVKSTAR